MEHQDERAHDEERYAHALADVLRDLRGQQGISQEELGFRSSLHRNYIGHVERAEKSPSMRALISIAAALGLTPAELLALVERNLTVRSGLSLPGAGRSPIRFPGLLVSQHILLSVHPDHLDRFERLRSLVQLVR